MARFGFGLIVLLLAGNNETQEGALLCLLAFGSSQSRPKLGVCFVSVSAYFLASILILSRVYACLFIHLVARVFRFGSV